MQKKEKVESTKTWGPQYESKNPPQKREKMKSTKTWGPQFVFSGLGLDNWKSLPTATAHCPSWYMCNPWWSAQALKINLCLLCVEMFCSKRPFRSWAHFSAHIIQPGWFTCRKKAFIYNHLHCYIAPLDFLLKMFGLLLIWVIHFWFKFGLKISLPEMCQKQVMADID